MNRADRLQSRRQVSRTGARATIEWCLAHLSALRDFVSAAELEALHEALLGHHVIDPAAYVSLFNLSQILPTTIRPPELRDVSLGDLLEGLTLCHAELQQGLLPLLRTRTPRETALHAAFLQHRSAADPAIDADSLRALEHDRNVGRLDQVRRENEPGWRPHAEAHRRTVLALVDQLLAGTRPARIAYLGAGRLDDVPVLELAGRCDELVLVDIDAAALEEAIASLPASARGRVRGWSGDSTGIGASLRRRVARGASST